MNPDAVNLLRHKRIYSHLGHTVTRVMNSELLRAQFPHADPSKLFITRDTSVGKGIFTTVNLPKNTKLGWYVGQVVHPKSGDPADKLLVLRVEPPWWSSVYPDTPFGDYQIVNGDQGGNFLATINDYRNIAASPNVTCASDGLYLLTRDVLANEELLTNYGEGWWREFNKRQNQDGRSSHQHAPII